MKTAIHYITAVALATTIFTSCKSKEDTGPCAGVACTAMFAMIPITVTDSAGGNIKADRVFTLRTDKKGADTVKSYKSDGINNTYIVVDDNYVSEMQNSTHTFKFVCMRNGVVIVDEPFTISADCCHIKKESGKETLVIK